MGLDGRWSELWVDDFIPGRDDPEKIEDFKKTWVEVRQL